MTGQVRERRNPYATPTAEKIKKTAEWHDAQKVDCLKGPSLMWKSPFFLKRFSYEAISNIIER
ncbi:hypothetical protein CHCC14820_3173 [Bacillus paralicheniformis]|uniref:Uncharacterized protein n=1 Tax=Bacillus paralicheniformis TaxID=1648923 RepID=A0A6I7TL37_9BACI|nr:hypothetical protein SC10_B2orf02551 [Bacillus paralicheniformis]AUZ38465.1 hypothetical protein C1T29_09195 [Bacillus sp. MBGLi79]ETB70027.1 hypothetical protein A943_18295 [Bacillus sp. CPSM8]KJD52884.1 hypothetical protein UZ38_35450 [Bacillus amyloliquefaciens]KUL14396.1 hypothetical protein LI7559_01845 [Bacillus licheniformis LMG 7559]POO83038.1 hypothetical protein C1T30_06650 [Bacillus sp. MBGLi97]